MADGKNSQFLFDHAFSSALFFTTNFIYLTKVYIASEQNKQEKNPLEIEWVIYFVQVIYYLNPEISKERITIRFAPQEIGQQNLWVNAAAFT